MNAKVQITFLSAETGNNKEGKPYAFANVEDDKGKIMKIRAKSLEVVTGLKKYSPYEANLEIGEYNKQPVLTILGFSPAKAL